MSAKSDMTYLLRMEGVNLSNVLDDTNDISVRRGSGLMLRQAVLDIDQFVKELQPISIGASVGLFQFSTGRPEAIVERARELLAEKYPYLTFVVDFAKYKGSFRQSLEAVISKNRFRQFQQVTLVPPAIEAEADCCCEMTQLHPCGNDIRKGKKVSASVQARFDFGRERRQQFYTEELEDAQWAGQFTDDLSQLAAPGAHQDFANLNDKMAVIYLDGNRFGNIQRKCQVPDDLSEFDKINRDNRRGFLKRLIRNAVTDSNFMDEKKRIRLEVLLWGGDEIIMIVPAWKGFEVMQEFYMISKDWKFQDNPLMHAGGIVFCHHKTPINQAIKSAKELAEYVKEKVSRAENRFDYLVLESIDYPTQPIDSFWDERYGKGVKQRCPSLSPVKGDWRRFYGHLCEYLEELPKGAILDVAGKWLECWRTKGGDDTELAQRVERVHTVNSSAYDNLFEIVFPLLVSPAPSSDPSQQKYNPGWVHLTELWDYLAPINRKGAQ